MYPPPAGTLKRNSLPLKFPPFGRRREPKSHLRALINILKEEIHLFHDLFSYLLRKMPQAMCLLIDSLKKVCFFSSSACFVHHIMLLEKWLQTQAAKQIEIGQILLSKQS